MMYNLWSVTFTVTFFFKSVFIAVISAFWHKLQCHDCVHVRQSKQKKHWRSHAMYNQTNISILYIAKYYFWNE